MRSNVAKIAGGIIVIMIGLAAADFVFVERPRQLVLQQQNAKPVPAQASSSSTFSQTSSSESSPTMQRASDSGAGISSSGTSESGALSSSVPHVVKKGISLKKKSSVDVASVLASLQFIPEQTKEIGLLAQIVRGTVVQTEILLQNNDRAALFSWLENDEVKAIFSRLKQALQERFSPKLKDLIDETLTPSDGPPVDVLSFSDLGIAPEKVIFIRVRNRLYEFHVAAKSEAAISQLIAALSK